MSLTKAVHVERLAVGHARDIDVHVIIRGLGENAYRAIGKGAVNNAGVLAGSLPPVEVIAVRGNAQLGGQPARAQ